MEEDPDYQRKRDQRERLLSANREAAQFYHRELFTPEGAPIYAYLQKRGLSDGVLADLAASREYWAQFETPVQSVSNTVYEGFLQSYDQKLGMKSYGACVDLLVNYYYETALAHFGLA